MINDNDTPSSGGQDSIPMLSPELKQQLREKLQAFEVLEEQIGQGLIAKDQTEALLNAAMAEVEAILNEGRALERAFKAEQAQHQITETSSPIIIPVSRMEPSLDDLPKLSPKENESGKIQDKLKTVTSNKASAIQDESKASQQERTIKATPQRKKPEARVGQQKSKKTQLRSKSKKKLRVPTKAPRAKKKKPFPVGLCILVLVLAVGGFFFKDAISFIKQQQAELAEKNKPKIVPKKEKPKPKPKPKPKVVVEAPKKEEPEEPENFFQPEEDGFFTGELKHYSFNEVLKTKCVSCHGAEGKEAEGDFNIARLMASKSTNSKTWAKIYRSINKGEMPPPVEDEPDSIPLEKEEQELLLASIKMMFDDLKEGVTTRVMTPYEVQNTLGDLFDIDYSQYNPVVSMHQSYSEKSFYTHQRKILSPHYISNYYNILYDMLQSFIGLRPQLDPLNQSVKFPSTPFAVRTFGNETNVRWPQYNPRWYCSLDFKDLSEKKESKQDRYLDANENQVVNKMLAARSLPPGTYKLTFKASCENMSMSKITKEKYGEAIVSDYEQLFEENDNLTMPVRFYLEPPGTADPFAKLKYLETMEISSEGDYGIEFEIKRRSGVSFALDWKSLIGRNRLASMLAYHRHGEDAGEKEQEEARAYLDRKQYDFPYIKMWDQKIEGPFNVNVNPLSFQQKEKIIDMEVREKFKLLHTFNGMKLSVIYTYMFGDLRKQKMKMEDAYRNTMITFFMSPRFLILDSAAKTAEEKIRYTSYMTHKSPPSAEFINTYKTAAKKKDYKGLGNWLIQHDHFRRFSNAFTYQWLKLGEISNNLPDEGKFRDYHRNNLQELQQQEAEFFLLNLFRENRPIVDLVKADYSFLDKELIDFYGVDAVEGQSQDGQFIKMNVSNADRGGILSMGAFLTATGNGVDPLPIKRAAWISENILDSPLPSPPDVDVNDFEDTSTGRTLRERLEVHAQNPACNSCHKRLDSLAILMDKYDSIGGYNNHFVADPVKINDQKVTDVTKLKDYLGSYSQSLMARAFSKKLISYMTSREPGVQDEAKLDAILEATKEKGYRVGDLYAEIVKHYVL
ncbi:DUF1588 domain-containing protein [Lentisphaera profundi]|uniref:DUF1588 domain-containing protein n=1 Tax=Lentisphaera profundi TaxID=1658616 RepID=A0ABY7VW18_9BACT|nr:DUF1588 domain-containing protein [Lentisphaera profundi]WDE98418.1 DUF1588 domain-containing protein [Lentisphaera profundi]